MEKLFLLLFVIVLSGFTKSNGIGKAASYALPVFSGTAVSQEVKQIGGAFIQ